MKRNSGKHFRYDGLYRDDLLRECLERSAFNSAYALAKHLGVNIDTTYRVFNGTASHKQVWPIAEFFGVDWKLVHDLTIPSDELHRLVLAGEPSSER
jgi:hypothetical protein